MKWNAGCWQCWKFPQVRRSEADNFGGGRGTFWWLFFNFMFMTWNSRHEDLQLFDWVSNTGCWATFALSWVGVFKFCMKWMNGWNKLMTQVLGSDDTHSHDLAVTSLASYLSPKYMEETSLNARFMGPTWGPSGADRTQVGPTLAPCTLLSGV